MKKYVVGFLAGAVFMLSAQAFGATSGFIGKKVDGQTPVKTTSGEVIGQAVIIQGKSFAPVRDLTNAFGGTVKSATSGGIVLDTVNQLALLQADNERIEKEGKTINLKQSIEYKQKEISATESEIENVKKLIGDYQAQVDKAAQAGGTSTASIPLKIYKDNLVELEGKLGQQQKELTDLEAQLAELQK